VLLLIDVVPVVAWRQQLRGATLQQPHNENQINHKINPPDAVARA
jgi:hypothetical protein